ncbi:riboflavin kinase / FAD synthetase [Necator americanus]|uniref:riboflavin kinase n=1 Tax=Necator americanus TaxID=51031 RepID=W2SIW9_NECAM|nr:riboflavin kinase / FAD synthetase [Necator americanus]ETN69518.1 riboflavin kinase / FAD synthetase [Necator americanus]
MLLICPVDYHMRLNRHLPYFLRGRVVAGFGRGGKQLGCPTANIEEAVVETLPSEFPCGVFYGLARVDGEQVDKMVMSIGRNPHYHNEKKTLEVHLLRKFENDFYGSMVDVLILGFIRPMAAFNNLDELRTAISSDIALAEKELKRMDTKQLTQQFFH